MTVFDDCVWRLYFTTALGGWIWRWLCVCSASVWWLCLMTKLIFGNRTWVWWLSTVRTGTTVTYRCYHQRYHWYHRGTNAGADAGLLAGRGVRRVSEGGVEVLLVHICVWKWDVCPVFEAKVGSNPTHPIAINRSEKTLVFMTVFCNCVWKLRLVHSMTVHVVWWPHVFDSKLIRWCCVPSLMVRSFAMCSRLLFFRVKQSLRWAVTRTILPVLRFPRVVKFHIGFLVSAFFHLRKNAHLRSGTVKLSTLTAFLAHSLHLILVLTLRCLNGQLLLQCLNSQLLPFISVCPHCVYLQRLWLNWMP
jgi:hypothetical protein